MKVLVAVKLLARADPWSTQVMCRTAFRWGQLVQDRRAEVYIFVGISGAA